MSSLELPAPSAMPMPRPPRTWYFLGTAVVALIAYAAMLLGQMIVIVLEIVRNGDPDITADQARALMQQGGPAAMAIIAACPFVLAALWAATRIARRKFASYLALRRPSRAELVRGLVITFGFLVAWDLLSLVVNQPRPAYVIDTYRSARDSGTLWLLLTALCVVAPVTEEFAVRGFLFRGWSKSFLGPVGAIVLCSALWASLHVQYSWYYMLQVFLVGLIFGYLRYRSGSTWLTVVLHGSFNLAVMIQIAWIVGRT